MGLSITTIRLSAKAAKTASKKAMLKVRDEARALREINEDTRRKMEERLHILEKMVLGHLDVQQHHIIAGERRDQQIHSGTVVQAFKQVNIVMQDQPSEDMEDAIDEFFKGSFMSGFSKLVAMSVKAVLGNSSVGEYQSSSMLIVWTDNALLRCDTYCYRWNFSSAGVIEQVEGAVGVLMIQRVIDLTKTDPQVLSWAITRQARACPDMIDMFEKAMAVLIKAAKFQREMKEITNGAKKHSLRKCTTDDHNKGSPNVTHHLKNQNNQRPNVERSPKTRKRVPDSFSKKPKMLNRPTAATRLVTKRRPKLSNQSPYQFDSPPEIKQENFQAKGLSLSTQDGHQVNLVQDDDIITERHDSGIAELTTTALMSINDEEFQSASFSNQQAFFSSCDKTNVSFIPPTLESRGVVQRTIAGLYHPWGVAVSNSGEVVVSEHFGNCVSVYGRDGEKMGSFRSHGFGKEQFLHPHGVAITSDNHVLVVDEANHRIQMWSLNGTFMGVVGQKGRHPLQFYFPSGITVHPSGSVFVADTYNHRIQVLHSDLSFSHMFGSEGSAPGQLKNPRGVACDSSGTVYVTDFFNHRVQLLSFDGQFISSFGTEQSRNGHLYLPAGIAIDSTNTVYITDRNHRLSMYTSSGQFIKCFGTQGSGEGEFRTPTEIAVDDTTGALYVCDYWNNRVVVY